MPQPLNAIAYYVRGLYQNTEDDHCFLLAAGIAFNVLYCVLPLSLIIFYFVSAALTTTDATQYILHLISDNLPIPVYQAEVTRWVSHQIDLIGQNRHLAGIIGGVTLFWLASILFSTLRSSLNAVLHFPPKRNYFLLKLRDFFLIIIVLVLLLSTTVIEPIWSIVEHLGTHVLPQWLAGLVGTIIPYLVSAALSILLYLILFWLLPHEKLPGKAIVISAMTTVVLTEVTRQVFLYYMSHASSIGALYGTYAFLVGASLWVYYASLAFLIGGEVGRLYVERTQRLRCEPAPSSIT